MYVVLGVGAPPVHAAEMSRSDLITLAEAIAQEHKITNVPAFVETMECESHFYYDAISPTGDYGVAQINLHYHPDVTKAEAEDPYFALEWAAKAWQAGHERWWSCYRILERPKGTTP